MRWTVELNSGTHGDLPVEEYEFTVWRTGEAVRATFRNVKADGAWPKGGGCSIPSETARMLGHALLAAAAGSTKTTFTVKE